MTKHKPHANHADSRTGDSVVNPADVEPTQRDEDATGPDDRDGRGRDGEGEEYRPVLPPAPDEDSVDGEDGSSAEWVEAGVDGEPRLAK